MRYVFFAVLGFISLVLCGSFFGIASIAGLVPDLILLIGLSIALNERSVLPLIFVVVFGLLFDDLFSPVLGGNAMAYAVSIVLVQIFTSKINNVRIWTPPIVGFSAYIVKELILAIVVFALGNRFDMGYMFSRFILPGALLTAGLMIPAFYVFRWLYSFSWIRPRKIFKDEFDL